MMNLFSKGILVNIRLILVQKDYEVYEKLIAPNTGSENVTLLAFQGKLFYLLNTVKFNDDESFNASALKELKIPYHSIYKNDVSMERVFDIRNLKN